MSKQKKTSLSRPESTIMKACAKAVSSESCKIFRNNVGKGWIGKSKYINYEGQYFCKRGDVIIRNARRFESGLCEGSSDLIGWRSVEITPDMVGKKIAVFTAIETKTACGKASKPQERFLNAVKIMGGFAGVARSEKDALLITGQQPHQKPTF